MLEELEGRLSWEKTAHGIVVQIPARRGSMFTLFGPIVGIWLMIAAGRYSLMVGTNTSPEENQSAIIWIIVGGFGVTFCILLVWLAWAFTSEYVLTLDETSIKIQHRVLGIEMVTNSYSTQDAHNFQFIRPTAYWSSKEIMDPRTTRIQFQVGPRTHSFAPGVTEVEATALLEKMHQVYRFPDFHRPR